MSDLFELRVETSLGSFEATSTDFTSDEPSNPIAAIALAFIRPRVAINTPFGRKTIEEHGEPLSPLVGWAIVGGILIGLALLVRRI